MSSAGVNSKNSHTDDYNNEVSEFLKPSGSKITSV